MSFKELTWDTAGYFMDNGWELPDSAFMPGHRYLYRVRGHGDAGFGSWSPEYVVSIPPFLPPKNVTATLLSQGLDEFISVQWDAVDVPGISYEVHRDTELDGYYPRVQTQTGTIYEDSDVDLGYRYYYKISCVHNDYGATDMSEVAFVIMDPLPAPVMHEAVLEGDSIIVSWFPVDEADRYRLYRSEANPDGSYTALWSDFEHPDQVPGGHIVTDGVYLTFTDSDIETGTDYYYKAQCEAYEYGGGPESALSATPASFEGGGGSGSWVTLESGFPSTAFSVELVTHNNELYAVLPDEADTDRKIKVMKNSGNDGAAWSDVGGYISLAGVQGDYACLYSSGGSLYVAYADTEESVASGGTPRLFVKEYIGGGWSAVGSAGGVSIYDTDAGMAQGKWGSVPAITAANTSLFLVYRTGSFGLVDSLSYTSGEEYWDEADSSFWYPDNTITAAWTALETDSSGSPIAALQGASSTLLELYRYDSGSWASYSMLDLSEKFAWLEPSGFFLDHSDNAYVACETYSDTTQYSAGVYRYNGSIWTDIGLVTQLQDVDIVTGIAITGRASGGGVSAAIAYKTTGGTYFLELWEYDGSGWQQVGPDIELAAWSESLSVALDTSDWPVIICTTGDAGDVAVNAYRE